MATLADLKEEAAKVKDAEVTDEFDDEPDLEQARDILEAISLIKKSMHFFAVLSDVDLCKTVSKREREVCAHMSDQLRHYLDDVSPHYGDEE